MLLNRRTGPWGAWCRCCEPQKPTKMRRRIARHREKAQWRREQW